MTVHGLGYSTPAFPDRPAAVKRAWWDPYLAPAFITLILLVGNWHFGMLESPQKTAAAIGTSIVCEIVLSLLVVGRVPHLASAYISGISVGILVRSVFFWPYPLCAAISIVSKYALRVGGRHLWNPSNFAVSALLFLAPWAVTSLSLHWGNNLAPMVVIWCLGFAITWRVRRMHMSLTYALSFIFFAYIRHLFTGDTWSAEVAPITGPMYMLFTFFMVTDPKTTVKPLWAQYLVVFLIALVEAILRVRFREVHAAYYALFIIGPCANLIEIMMKRSKPRSA